ncbi:sulfatase [Aquimarina algiphila]|uniref:sulfatase family protein n=1 Tax=Aquimarina algiphila TaxID=2047982 RepID=UPI00232CA0D2|nr:sulfatase-like hydrolase/transferase [Aquimarina algiphila]
MKKIYIKFIVFFCLYLLIAGCKQTELSQVSVEKKRERPNILIILSDDQGWGDVGFNGGTDIPTPNLDQLAKEGISFEAGYASHPYCSPSRAGLLSGRYQQRFGHENNTPYDHADPDAGLPLNELILSEILQQNGYQTCAIGKWHLGDDKKFWPNQRGFDDWFGFYGGGLNYWGNTGEDIEQKMKGILKDGVPVPQNELTYLTDDFTNEAISYIDKYSKNTAPFFMYLAYNAPHAPIQATDNYLKAMEHMEYGDRAAYGAMVVGMDTGIGKVIEKLKETGEYENTLIFFYSDNGGHIHSASSAPFRGHKGMLFEGGIRVPFLVSWPKHFYGGKRYQKPISALDIYPTVLSASRVKHPKPESLDGVDLTPYLKNQKNENPHDILYWRYSNGAGFAMRKGNFKMVYSGYKQKFHLFDLVNDPYEHHNLVSVMPEKLEELKKEYISWTKGTIAPKWSDPHAENVLKEEKKRQWYIDKAKDGEKEKIYKD